MGTVGAEDYSQAQRPSLRIPSHAQVVESSSEGPPLSSEPRVGETSVLLSSLSQQQQQQERVSGGRSSFAEAFSFVRQTEFYIPPPPALPPPSKAGIGSRPKEAPLPTATLQAARNAILVSRRQQGNPLLKYIRNVRWVYGDIVPDYMLGQTTCALYISLRYHLLHPDYLYFRIRELQKDFRLRVVLCHVDLEDVIKPLHEVTKTTLLHDCSLLCAWSLEECARYLETLKTYENKPADNIQERTDNDYLSRITSALTTVRHVNKTDVLTLGSTFETAAGIFGASMDDLARCPGIGERKVKRLYNASHEPFRQTTKQLRLDDILVKRNRGGNVDASTPVHDSSTKQAGTIGAREPNADEPKLSVRSALEFAFAKGVKRKRGTRTEASMKDLNINSRNEPPVNIEVIDITQSTSQLHSD